MMEMKMRFGFLKSVVVLLIAVTAIAQFRFSMESGFDTDEIEHAHVTWLLSQGTKPYSEIHQIHTPLLWICVTPIIKALPESAGTLLVLRAICLFAFAGSCFAGFLMLRHLNVKYHTATAAVFMIIAIAFVGQLQLYRFRPDPFMALCVAWAIVVIQRLPVKPVWYSFVSGLLLGLGTSFTPKTAPLCFLVPILCLDRCRHESSWKPMWLVIPNVVGFISGLFPMIVWLWWNDLFGSFFEWVIINSAHTLSTIDLSSGYYLHGGGILLPLTLIGGVLLLLNPSQQGNERFAARTLVAGTALAWLVRFLHPNQLLYNLQAFAIPGAILAAIALIRLFPWIDGTDAL